MENTPRREVRLTKAWAGVAMGSFLRRGSSSRRDSAGVPGWGMGFWAWEQ